MEGRQQANKKNIQDFSTPSKPTKTAVALSYEPEDGAPRVVASGTGYLAEKIIEKAKESHVPLHQDSKLAETLSKLEIGDAIPPELYHVVAEILVFVDDMEHLKKKIDGRNVRQGEA